MWPSIRIFLIACIVMTAVSEVSRAQSLWQQQDSRYSYLFRNTNGKQVGDLVTILISENTDVQNRDQRALDKATDTNFNFDFASAGNGNSAAGNLAIAGDSSRTFGGNSQYRVETEFTDRITVPVLEVLPNGNLLVAGKRHRRVNDETRQLEVSGVVRPIDIGPGNTIRSQFIANFEVKYSGCGPESHFTNQGWAGRILNRVWPF